NRIQHALHAFTPRDQKAVKAAAETFAPNPKLDVARVIGTMGVGEALASTLRDKGAQTPVERVLVSTPTCRLGPITDEERATIRSRSPVGPKYDTSTTANRLPRCWPGAPTRKPSTTLRRSRKRKPRKRRKVPRGAARCTTRSSAPSVARA